ncbi:MAG: PqqD family protein [Nitrospirae bacterium]|nr:PqqD family protein [Nitrospirota bacterium]
MSDNVKDNAIWRPKVKDGVLFRAVDDEMVVFDPEGDEVHLLNLTAAAAFEMCDGTLSIDEIIANIKSAAKKTDSLVESDIHKLFSELSEKKILE